VAAGGSVIDPLVVDELVEARTSRANSPLRELTESERVKLDLRGAEDVSRRVKAALVYLADQQ